MSESDEQLKIIRAAFPNDFESLVNDLLKEGSWRIVQTEMSESDHHYVAMLIKSAPPPQPDEKTRED